VPPQPDRFAAWASSPDDAVTVLAAPGGVPLEVHLSGGALRLRPDVLARSVLATAATAGRQATARLHAELAGTVGPEATRTLAELGLPAPGPGPDDPDDPDDPFDGGSGPLLRSAR
jgi:hypothetical protein